MGPDLAGWCASAAGCTPGSAAAHEALVRQPTAIEQGTLVSQGEGNSLGEEQFEIKIPCPPGWGLIGGLTTLSCKNSTVAKNSINVPGLPSWNDLNYKKKRKLI